MKIKKRWKILAGAFLLLLVLLVALTIYFEDIATKIVASQLKTYGLQGSFEGLDLGLLRGTCALSGIDLKLASGEALLTAERAGVNMNFWKALSGRYEIQQAELSGAHGQVRVEPDGQLSLLTLLSKQDAGAQSRQQPPSSSGGGPSEAPFSLDGVSLENVRISIEDSRADSPISSAELVIGQLSINFKKGQISAGEVKIETSQDSPSLNLKSFRLEGKPAGPLAVPQPITRVEIDGLKTSNSLGDDGRLLLLAWLEGIAEANGLLGQKGESDSEPTAPFPIPTKVSVQNADLGLDYPSPSGQSWFERVSVDSLLLDTKAKRLEISGLAWNNNRERLAGIPVVALGNLRLEGDLLSSPRRIQSVKTENLAFADFKSGAGDYDLMQRLNRISGLLGVSVPPAEGKPEASSPAPPPLELSGKIDLENIQARLFVVENRESSVDNVVQLDSAALDFDGENFLINGLRLSDTEGAFDSPSVNIASIHLQGGIHYPLPMPTEIQSVLVEKPAIHLVREGTQSFDLVQRLEQLLPASKKPGKQPEAKDKSTVQIRCREAELRDMKLTLLHQWAPDQSVKHVLEPGRLVVKNIVYPRQGDGWEEIDLETAFVEPSSGRLALQAKLHQATALDNFQLGRFEVTLEDVTALRAYYENKLPVRIESGGFRLAAEGKCTNGQLDIPYRLAVVSPSLKPKTSGKFNPLKGISDTASQTLVDGLKDTKGELRFQDRITGSLTNPKYVNPWAGMGKVLSGQLTNRLKNMPGMVKDLGVRSKDAAKSLTDQVGGVGKTVGNTLFGPGKKKQQE